MGQQADQEISASLGLYSDASLQKFVLKIVTINRNMSLEEFNRQHPSGASLEVLALINQVESNGQLRTGQQVKRIVGEKFE